MKINFGEEDNNSIIIAMEIGYKALADLADLYRESNEELLKELSIFENKSIKEIKKEINESLLRDENEEVELLSRIKAAQELIRRFNQNDLENPSQG